MASKNWLFSGMYLSSILIGWGVAFAGSQYLYRTLILDDLDSIVNPTVEEAGKLSDNASAPRTPSKSSYTTSITRRNIFDSSQTLKPPEVSKSTGEDMTISDIDAQLMGTIVMKPAESSLAMIQVRSNSAITPYGIGDQLLDATVEVIEPEYVWIRRNSQLEVLQLHGEKKVAGSANKAKEKSKSDDDSGVSKSGKDKYTVDQAVFDELLQNPEKLYSQIRATEHKKDGEVDGYRVSGIRRKSIFYKLGIKNGDVIHNVNGMSLTNLNDAMKAFESLQSSRDFNFDITRRRKKRTMEYEVR